MKRPPILTQAYNYNKIQNSEIFFQLTLLLFSEYRISQTLPSSQKIATLGIINTSIELVRNIHAESNQENWK